MELLYISSFQFVKKNSHIYSLPAYSDCFWQKYLDVFDTIHVLGEDIKPYLRVGTLSELYDTRISVDILKSNTHPKDFINDKMVRSDLVKHISNAKAILIKPCSRKGIMAIRIAEYLNKPYMIEVTGDLKETLKHSKSLLKRLYAPYIHYKICKAIKPCRFGLYVSNQYLQNVYKIQGVQCGCTDANVSVIDENILLKRIEKINSYDNNTCYNIGLIGSYHDDRKGIDIAIKAISQLKCKNKVSLNILGIGTDNDRNKWRYYASKYGVSSQLHFLKPFNRIEEVLGWIDKIDVCILPSRSEGLPRCIIEALSRACPCIVSNVCGLPELVNEQWLHSPTDSKQLAFLLDRMLSDVQLMKDAAMINFKKSKCYQKERLRDVRNRFLCDFKKYCQSL